MVPTGGFGFQAQILNCRLGASVTIAATPAAPNRGDVDVVISDSSTSSARQERYRYEGTLTTETTIVRTGGASDGTTPISWKVVTTANAKQTLPFECFELWVPNSAVGSGKTVTVEIVNDGTTLKDTEAWIEVEYLGSSSYPLASRVTTRAALLSSGSNLPSSSATWTTTGLTSPIKQYLQASFTPQMVGLIRVRVFIARASKTIYVDPVITVT